MTSRWFWFATQLSRRIWVRATLFSLMAVVVALVGIALNPYIPSDIPTKIGADAVDRILGIIASSMLTVTTFSLSTMVSAYSAATSNVTPRATRLVMEDSTTQNVLSTFVGSFLFSLVGIIVLSTGAYGAQGRVVLFVATLLVIALIVVTLLRWIDHLSRLGRVTETTARVEEAAAKAFSERHENPYLGGSPLLDAEQIPRDALAIHALEIGYVQHIDIGALSALTEEGAGPIYLNTVPGDFVDRTEPLAWCSGAERDDIETSIRNAITVSDVRSFDQDPRFGASVLSEIGQRALSPGINDPGTAIDVIGRMVRLIEIWSRPTKEKSPRFPAVFVPPIHSADIFDDLFTPIARDGAGVVEICLRLQKAFIAAERFSPDEFGPSARRHSKLALQRAETALPDYDAERVRRLASELIGQQERTL